MTHPTVTTRFLLGRAVITFVTLVALIAALRLPSYRLPFDREGDGQVSRVSALARVPLPPALRPGDRIAVQDQTLRVRTLLVSSYVPPDRTYPFVIRRGDQRLTIPVSTVRSPEDGDFLWAVNLVTVFVIGLLGLLTLWRGTSWSAWGLTMFASGILCGSTAAQTPAAPFGNIALFMTGWLLTGPLPLIGLYLMATDLTGRSARSRPRLTSVFAASAVGMLGFQTLSVVGTVFYGIGSPTVTRLLSYCLAACMVGIPLLVLTSGYVGAPAAQKLRIRWVLASTALLIPLLASNVVDQLHLVARADVVQTVTVLRALLVAVIFGLYAYAVLSQRLVEVRVVVNRALVFGALMTVVVGALALVEHLIERSALDTGAGLALELAVPLALGVLFNRLHRWIEAAVDRVLFHSEHSSRAALRDFVRDAGFIENADVLVGRMVSTFARHAGGRGAALFELRGGGMERSAQDGSDNWPGFIEADDPMLVRLRATLCPLDLHESESAFGGDGLALPLALRGRIFGVLVCGTRAASRYAQAEMSELGRAAHDVGASLFALRARANEVLIERLAQGQMHAEDAVVQARQLAGLT